MKNLQPIIFLTLLFISQLAVSQRPQNNRSQQNKIEITGKVIDKETKQPLEYATIVLTAVKTKKVTGGITDAKGNFSIQATKGVYNIAIEFLSLKTYKVANKKVLENTNIGTIALEADAESLEEVEIIAEKTTVEIKLDKKIYNVGKDLTVRGGTVSDVLDNVPSVSVDVEGNVALRGNENVRILINGKPSGLVGLNSTDALRQLPADAIQKVEVITSPSARYDAQGTAGILNIVLRRSKIQGLNGALTLNAGIPTAAGISGNLNYRTGDVNFFTTSGYRYRKSPGNIYSATTFRSNGYFIEEDKDFDRIRNGYNTNIGLEWYVNKTASITTSVLIRESDNESNTTNKILQRYADGTEINSVRFDPEKEDDKTIQYSLNFDKKFKNDGEKFTFDFQYEDSAEDEYSLVTQDLIEKEKVVTIEDQQRILLQSDYVLPIGKNTQFEFGYRGNFINKATDYRVDSINNGINYQINNLTNKLKYREYINALYSQYGTKFNKLSVLLGLRLETTRITVATENEIANIPSSIKSYARLFPTVNLGYELSEKENLTFGYNRRIRRPRSFFINPFPSRSSTTSFFQGNPDLDPSISDAIDLGYLNRLGKFTVNSSVYYQHATDVFTFLSEPTGETVLLNGQEVPVIRRTPLNLNTQDRYGFEFTLSYRPSRKWRINSNFNVFRASTKGKNSLGEVLDASNTSWSARLNNKLTLPGKIDWQTSFNVRGPRVTAQNKSKPVFSSNMALSKDLFKEKASITFNVNDIFNTRKRISDVSTPSFYGRSEFQFRQRSFNLAFTYRFNQKKKRQRSQRNYDGGGEEFGG